MNATHAIGSPPVAAASARTVSVPVLIGGTLALVSLAPPLLGGFVFLDWADTVEAAVVGAMEAAVVLVWAGRGRPLPRADARWVPLLTVCWLAAMVLTTATAVDVAPALVRTAAWIAHAGFACVLWAEAQRSPDAARAVERGALGGFVAALGIGVGIWLWERHTGAVRNWAYDVPFVGGVRWAGVYGLVGVCFSARGLLGRRLVWRAAGPFVAANALGWAALWWSASRGAIGGAAVAVAFLVWASASRRAQTGAALVGGALAGAALSLLIPVDVEGVGLWRFLPGYAPDTVGLDAFTSGRTVLWGMAVEAWQRHPWLGLGPGATVPLLVPVGNAHTHNAVLQALVEWGLAGAVPFVLLAAGLLWRSAAVRLGDHVGAAAYLLAAGAASMLDGLTSDPATTALVAASAGLVLASHAGPAPARAAASAWSPRLGVAAAGALAVFALHLVVLRAVWAPGTPTPASARARLVLAVPTYPHAKDVEGWGRAWMAADPEAAARIVRWGLARERSPWLFLRLRADLHLRRGDRRAAEADYRLARTLEEQATWRLAQYNAPTRQGASPGSLRERRRPS